MNTDKNNQKLIRLIEYKYGGGKHAEWRNGDFENLSFEIQKETKILISVATLKRYFGKVKTSDDYQPQPQTINALKLYAGYADEKASGFSFKWVGILMGIFMLLFVTWLIVANILSNNRLEPVAKLRLVKVEGKCPGTAFFEYSYYNIMDSVFLDFGDSSNWHYIDKDVRRSHFYAYPGVFNAKLRTRNKVLSDTAIVFIETDEWQALAHYFNPMKRDRYYPVPIQQNLNEGVFHSSMDKLEGLGLDTKEIVVVRLDNYNETAAMGDELICEARFKNSSFWPAIRCYSIVLQIQGSMGKLLFKLVGTGCSNYGELELGERIFNGANSDLSAFVVDNSDWVNVQVVNQNKQVEVFINNQSVFSGSYKTSIGQVLGVSIIFHGIGSVDYLKLNTLNHASIISTDF